MLIYLSYKSKHTLCFLTRTDTVKVRGNLPSLTAYVFQIQGSPCNYQVWKEKIKHQLLGLMCKSDRLWSLAGSLCSFAGSSL